MYVHVYVCTRMCIHVCMYMHVCTCMYMYVCRYVFRYVYVYMGLEVRTLPPKKSQKIKNKLNVVSPAGRSWSAFSDIWIISPLKTNKQKMSSELQSRAPSYIFFWIRAYGILQQSLLKLFKSVYPYDRARLEPAKLH